MRLRIILFTLLSITLVNAQDNGEDKWGAWYMLFGTNKITDDLSIHIEGQFRYYEQAKNFNQLLLRTGLNYHINPNAMVTLGYGYIDTDPTFEEFVVTMGDVLIENNKVIENRIYEQLILKNQLGSFNFEHRYRLEQRFLKFDNPFDTAEKITDTQHRIRYRLQVTVPLSKLFFLNFYDEIFLNLQDNVFGQNRLYGALGINLIDNLSMQVGYLKNQFPNARYDRIQIGLFFNTDLRKKEKLDD